MGQLNAEMTDAEFWDAYQTLALRTESPRQVAGVAGRLWRLLHATLGLAGELTELDEAIERLQIAAAANEELDFSEMAGELGDFLWFCALGFSACGGGMAEHATPLSDTRDIASNLAAVVHLRAKVGQLVDAVKRSLYYADPETPEVDSLRKAGCLLSEIFGLVLSIARDGEWVLDLPPELRENSVRPKTIAIANIEKLKKRYREKFTEEAALNRDTDAEFEAIRLAKFAENPLDDVGLRYHWECEQFDAEICQHKDSRGIGIPSAATEEYRICNEHREAVRARLIGEITSHGMAAEGCAEVALQYAIRRMLPTFDSQWDAKRIDKGTAAKKSEQAALSDGPQTFDYDRGEGIFEARGGGRWELVAEEAGVPVGGIEIPDSEPCDICGDTEPHGHFMESSPPTEIAKINEVVDQTTLGESTDLKFGGGEIHPKAPDLSPPSGSSSWYEFAKAHCGIAGAALADSMLRDACWQVGIDVEVYETWEEAGIALDRAIAKKSESAAGTHEDAVAVRDALTPPGGLGSWREYARCNCGLSDCFTANARVLEVAGLLGLHEADWDEWKELGEAIDDAIAARKPKQPKVELTADCCGPASVIFTGTTPDSIAMVREVRSQSTPLTETDIAKLRWGMAVGKMPSGVLTGEDQAEISKALAEITDAVAKIRRIAR